jgi:hypothetical protein
MRTTPRPITDLTRGRVKGLTNRTPASFTRLGLRSGSARHCGQLRAGGPDRYRHEPVQWEFAPIQRSAATARRRKSRCWSPFWSVPRPPTSRALALTSMAESTHEQQSWTGSPLVCEYAIICGLRDAEDLKLMWNLSGDNPDFAFDADDD